MSRQKSVTRKIKGKFLSSHDRGKKKTPRMVDGESVGSWMVWKASRWARLNFPVGKSAPRYLFAIFIFFYSLNWPVVDQLEFAYARFRRSENFPTHFKVILTVALEIFIFFIFFYPDSVRKREENFPRSVLIFTNSKLPNCVCVCFFFCFKLILSTCGINFERIKRLSFTS